MEQNVINENKSNNIKKIIIGIIVVAMVVASIVAIISIVKPSPEKTVKDAIKYLNKGDYEALAELIDVKGMVAYSNAYGEPKDFKDEYDDLDDEWDDVEEDVQDSFDEAMETFEDEMMDLDSFEVEIKEIKKGKKLSSAKNLYRVKAKLKLIAETDGDTERETDTYEIYLLKDDGKFYIVGVEGGDIDYYTSSFYYGY